MKTRESGMPEEAYWESFFDAPRILKLLGFSGVSRRIAEFGCGYGTFTLAAAAFGGEVHTFDIDPAMVARTTERALAAGFSRIRCETRDFVENGTGLAEGSVDYAMLFNILHAAEAQLLLTEARRVLAPAGLLSVIHWNYDPATPRGPSLDIRPRPEVLQASVIEAGFQAVSPLVDLPPYHYGFLFRKMTPEPLRAKDFPA